jgi:predicted RNase H-like HicB family nuclease/DNA-binding XRE family transcriptional regulator
MTYHFRIHEEDGFWAECVELDGCVTQGQDRAELEKNMHEALNLYLEEPGSSTVVFPAPASETCGNDVVAVEVDPSTAFSFQLRQLRLRHNMTQKEAAERLGMRNLYSYQRLERRSNPSLSTIKKVKNLFPELSLDAVLGG